MIERVGQRAPVGEHGVKFAAPVLADVADVEKFPALDAGFGFGAVEALFVQRKLHR